MSTTRRTIPVPESPLEAAAAMLAEIKGLPSYSGQHEQAKRALREEAARILTAYRDADAARRPYDPPGVVVNVVNGPDNGTRLLPVPVNPEPPYYR